MHYKLILQICKNRLIDQLNNWGQRLHIPENFIYLLYSFVHLRNICWVNCYFKLPAWWQVTWARVNTMTWHDMTLWHDMTWRRDQCRQCDHAPDAGTLQSRLSSATALEVLKLTGNKAVASWNMTIIISLSVSIRRVFISTSKHRMYSYCPCVLFDVFLITNTTGIKNKENESKHYLKMLIKMDLNMKTKNRTQLFLKC